MRADLVVVNGTIHTMNPAQPQAEALAIAGGRVVAVGDNASVRPCAGPGSAVLDLGGRAAIPGMTDAHLHFISYGQSLQQVDLTGTRSLHEAVERVRARAAATPAGEWVIGRGWDRNLWSPPDWPTRQALDAVAPASPVVLGSKDGHAMWVNSATLRVLEIDAATADPEGGRIVRDAQTGEPTGILLENAMNELARRGPRPTGDTLRRAAVAAAERALSLGLTGVHDCEGGAMADLMGLWAERALPLRVYALIAHEELDAAIQMGLRTGFGDEWLRVGHLKLFADGSLGAHTADMLEPYQGEVTNCGVAVLETEALRTIIARAAQAGIAPAVHAIGDRANRRVLDAYAATQPVWSAARLRPRIEHVQLLACGDAARLAQLGVIASMQPIHATSDMEMADAYWGERGAGAYAWRSLLDAGAVLAFGSDCPVETPDPLAGIHAAVTRQRPDGTPTGGWRPRETLTVYDAVRAYTVGAAYAAGEEGLKGSLQVGKVGDLVVLSEDVFRVPAQTIAQVRVLATICGGGVAYSTGDLRLS